MHPFSHIHISHNGSTSRQLHSKNQEITLKQLDYQYYQTRQFQIHKIKAFSCFYFLSRQRIVFGFVFVCLLVWLFETKSVYLAQAVFKLPMTLPKAKIPIINHYTHETDLTTLFTLTSTFLTFRIDTATACSSSTWQCASCVAINERRLVVFFSFFTYSVLNCFPSLSPCSPCFLWNLTT